MSARRRLFSREVPPNRCARTSHSRPLKGATDIASTVPELEAARIDADAVGMGARNIKGLHAARGAEDVLRGAGVEGVGGQSIAPFEQPETFRRNDQMQIAGLAADRTIAVGDLRSAAGALDFESHAAAMTTAACA